MFRVLKKVFKVCKHAGAYRRASWRARRIQISNVGGDKWVRLPRMSVSSEGILEEGRSSSLAGIVQNKILMGISLAHHIHHDVRSGVEVSAIFS